MLVEVSYKFGSVRSSICLFATKISELACQLFFFLIFCMKLNIHSKKSDEAWFLKTVHKVRPYKNSKKGGDGKTTER